VFAFDPRHGNVIWRQRLTADHPALQGRRGFSATPVLLQSDGESLFMDRVRLDLATGSKVVHEDKRELMWCGVLGWLGAAKGSMYVGHASRTFRSHLGWGGHLLAGDKECVFGAAHWGQERLPGAARKNHAVFRASRDGVAWATTFRYAPHLRVQSILPAGRTLWVAVSLDTEEADGGELWAYDAESGALRQTTVLEASPVFEGLSAASGRLFVPGADGTLVCFE
jgi:hypothetical protein